MTSIDLPKGVLIWGRYVGTLTDKRNVIIINHYDSLASIGIYSIALKDALGVNAELYSLSPKSTLKEELNYPGVHIYGKFSEKFGFYILNQLFPSFSYKSLSQIVKKHKENGGVIHYSSSLMYPLEHSHDNVVSIHDIIFLKKTGKDAPLVQRKYFERSLEKFTKYERIITPTNFVKQELIQYGIEGNITVIPYGTNNFFRPLKNKTALRKRLGLPIDKRLILSVSTNVARKNLKTVEKVMERLGPEFKLVRVGPKIGNSYNFNSVFGEELNNIYNACDILLFPTLDEGLGYPLIEAFATSLPVVTSALPVCQEVGGESARYVEPLNISDIVVGIKDVLYNLQEYSKLSSQRAVHYTMGKFKQNILKFYSTI